VTPHPLLDRGERRFRLHSAYAPIPPAVWNPPPRRRSSIPEPVVSTPRLSVPEAKEITDPTRQATKRSTRGKSRCSLCRLATTPDDLCFYGGQDAHRSCAETLAEVLIDAAEEMREQRARRS
jgi:hypothetical protein